MGALQECYAKITGNYGDGGPHYDPNQGHRGTDYSRGGGQSIIAYDDMVLESIDSGSGLGVSIGLRRLTIGGYAGYAHVAGIRGREGTRFNKGDTLAYVAGWGDFHGTLWTGPHIHTTQGFVSAFNCSVGIRPLSDPAPTIAKAVEGSTAGGGHTPLPEEDQEEEMKTTGISWIRSSDGVLICALTTPGSGYWTEWSHGGGAFNSKMAVAFDTGDFVAVSESHAQALKDSAAAVRSGK